MSDDHRGVAGMRDMQQIWSKVSNYQREVALLESAGEVLAWDERTYLPAGAGEYRSEQLTLLAGLIHQRRTAAELGEDLAELQRLVDRGELPAGAEAGDVAVTLKWWRREYDKRTKLPQELVEALARAVSQGQQAWEVARGANDFAGFRPHLAELVRLKREQAQALGYTGSPYNALLDDYEPDATVAVITPLLAELRNGLIPLVQELSARSTPVDVLQRHFPTSDQRELGCRAATEFGFDFQRGRLDVTHHPFCLTAGPNDCRITTRFDEHFFSSAFFGILHEAGHGIYEQGLPAAQFGMPLGMAVSLGVHESQSRLWENLVGRSRAFWRYFYPQAQQQFGQSLGDTELGRFYAAINAVRPSLIRVEADEVTYNLHIVIRYELEQELFADQLQVDDLPQAWNDRYEKYLGIRPTSYADGVMQDIHWSAGLFGYFPTYSLGNIYAGMLWQAMGKQIGDLDELLARGEFQPIRAWLASHIYQHGRRWSAQQLIERACGQPTSSGPLIEYLQRKFAG